MSTTATRHNLRDQLFLALLLAVPLVWLGVDAIRSAGTSWPVGSFSVMGVRFTMWRGELSGAAAYVAGATLLASAAYLIAVVLLPEDARVRKLVSRGGGAVLALGFGACAWMALFGGPA